LLIYCCCSNAGSVRIVQCEDRVQAAVHADQPGYPPDCYVRVVAGDPSYFGSRMAIAAEEGVVIVSGTTTSAQRWLDGVALVTVSDGRLTIRNAPGAESNKICFVEITLRSVF